MALVRLLLLLLMESSMMISGRTQKLTQDTAVVMLEEYSRQSSAKLL